MRTESAIDDTGDTLEGLVRDWLASARAAGRSLRTLESYRWPVLNVLLPACRREGINSPAEIDRRFLDRLAGALLDSTLAPASVRTYLRQINVFLRWCEREGEGGRATAKLPKVPRKLLAVLSREEIQAMENAATSERDKLIVRTLADAGLRLGELLTLRMSDIKQDGQGWAIEVTGKGARERRVPIPPALGRRLRRYADRGRPHDAQTDRLLLTTRRDARTGQYEPLGKRTTEMLVKVLADRAGIDPKRVWPHVFRHSYCTQLLKKNVSPAKVMQLMGHSSMQMVMEVYNQLQPADALPDIIRALADQ